MTSSQSVDVWTYRALLALYPPAFRREFHDEMLEDFVLALGEARASGPRAVRQFRRHTVIDAAYSLPLQWFRSAWPALLGALLVLPVFWGSWLGSHLGKRTRFVLPAGSPERDVLGLVLLATVSVVLIATTIIVTVLFTSPHLRRRSRSR